MNHADRVIAEAQQAVKDYRNFIVRHPEAPALPRIMEVAYAETLQSPGRYVSNVITPEAIDIVSAYQRLRAYAETAKYTLTIYGVEA